MANAKKETSVVETPAAEEVKKRKTRSPAKWVVAQFILGMLETEETEQTLPQLVLTSDQNFPSEKEALASIPEDAEGTFVAVRIGKAVSVTLEKVVKRNVAEVEI